MELKHFRSFKDEEILRYLQDFSSAKLVAMTNGAKETYMASEYHVSLI